MWNNEMLTNEFMVIIGDAIIYFQGRVTIPISSIPVNREVEHWFPLHPTWAHKVKVVGNVKLKIKLWVFPTFSRIYK
jgi:hypothetical protein